MPLELVIGHPVRDNSGQCYTWVLHATYRGFVCASTCSTLRKSIRIRKELPNLFVSPKISGWISCDGLLNEMAYE